MIDIDICKTFNNFDLKASFKTNGAGITALFGPSGAGKTTLINIISGLLAPDLGHIRLNDSVLFDSQKKVNVPPEKRRVGYVFQEGRLFPHLSVQSNLTYGVNLLPGHKRYVNFDQVVEILGIGHLLHRHTSTLSGGEKQRIAIGRALLCSPSILLMDEPLASLDAARKFEVLPFIGKLPREFSIPILYVSHLIDEVLNLADKMAFMNSGRLIALDSIENIVNRPDFQNLTGRGGEGAVISTTVLSHDKPNGLTILRFAGGELKVPLVALPKGSPLRIRIPPRDVAIALAVPKQTSFQNIFPGEIVEVEKGTTGFITIRLDIGCPLIAKISPASFSELNISKGGKIFALIKTVSISVGKRMVLKGAES